MPTSSKLSFHRTIPQSLLPTLRRYGLDKGNNRRYKVTLQIIWYVNHFQCHTRGLSYFSMFTLIFRTAEDCPHASLRTGNPSDAELCKILSFKVGSLQIQKTRFCLSCAQRSRWTFLPAGRWKNSRTRTGRPFCPDTFVAKKFSVLKWENAVTSHFQPAQWLFTRGRVANSPITTWVPYNL